MTKRRRANATGRSVGEDGHVRLYWWILETDAARSLSPPAFKVLVYLAKREKGDNNGRIAFGARSGCFVRRKGTSEFDDLPIGLAPRTISDALYELEKAGFIRCTRESTFDQKRMTREWRLTWVKCGSEPPTKDFIGTTGPFRRPKFPKKQKPERVRALSGQIQSACAPYVEPQDA